MPRSATQPPPRAAPHLSQTICSQCLHLQKERNSKQLESWLWETLGPEQVRMRTKFSFLEQVPERKTGCHAPWWGGRRWKRGERGRVRGQSHQQNQGHRAATWILLPRSTAKNTARDTPFSFPNQVTELEAVGRGLPRSCTAHRLPGRAPPGRRPRKSAFAVQACCRQR